MAKIFKSEVELDFKAHPFVMERFRQHAAAAGQGAVNHGVGGDLVSIEREAYEKGFRAGEKAGFDFGKQKANVVFQGLAGILEEMSRARETMAAVVEREMVDLALLIAKKVLLKEAETDREAVLRCVRAGVKALGAAGEIKVRVNPKDLDVIHQYRPELTGPGDGVKGVSIEADTSIGRGGCILETNFGEVDVTFDGILGEIEEILTDGRGGEPE